MWKLVYKGFLIAVDTKIVLEKMRRELPYRGAHIEPWRHLIIEDE